MPCKCGVGSKTREDIQNVWVKVGSNTFKWADVKDVMQNSPQYYSSLNIFEVVGRDGMIKIYRLSSEYVPKEDKLGVNKSPMYPKRAFTGGERMKIDNRGEVDVNAIILAVVIASVAALVGFVLMANMETAIAPDMATSALSTSTNVVLNGFGTATTFGMLGAFVLAALGIVGILGSVVGRGE
jgi:hypothetical protein